MNKEVYNLYIIILETEERECLLLDEYAGCTTEDLDPSCSSGPVEMTTAEVGDVASDAEASDGELSSGDDSTDIDAVVKEYKDRVQVRCSSTLHYRNYYTIKIPTLS